MAPAKSARDQTMEDILASIQRMITDGGDNATKDSAAPAVVVEPPGGNTRAETSAAFEVAPVLRDDRDAGRPDDGTVPEIMVTDSTGLYVELAREEERLLPADEAVADAGEAVDPDSPEFADASALIELDITAQLFSELGIDPTEAAAEDVEPGLDPNLEADLEADMADALAGASVFAPADGAGDENVSEADTAAHSSPQGGDDAAAFQAEAPDDAGEMAAYPDADDVVGVEMPEDAVLVAEDEPGPAGAEEADAGIDALQEAFAEALFDDGDLALEADDAVVAADDVPVEAVADGSVADENAPFADASAEVADGISGTDMTDIAAADADVPSDAAGETAGGADIDVASLEAFETLVTEAIGAAIVPLVMQTMENKVEPDMSSETKAAAPTAEDRILSEAADAAIGASFNVLSRTVVAQNPHTIEDLVRDMLRPMLQSWLDENLPRIVERQVRAEIERVSRGER
ncbi:Cell pole-organizing protein PopZ [Pseudoxanthobacter soli DSM 19599]|uniref:Cell pole-organizing protein PopZ n=1 Tax=Pseudoxanthobacter soli DSM 19599 TaxID=1123029 RepID=A0A1M7Z4J6_9HYPH|nr:Cell pole-organizing protein PopZ [Pseudoxanthobacter soli DSM 19599]